MAWWAWVVLGFALVLVELMTPGGFFFLFFGIAGILVGLLHLAGYAGPAWLQWLLFSIISIVGVALFRRPLLAKFGMAAPKEVDLLVGEIGQVLQDIAVNSVGKAEVRGTPWTARNVGESSLAKGQRCKVERTEGLTLFIRAE